MRAKQFFYICAGVLMLAVAYQLGASRVQADWDPSTTGLLVGGDDATYYTANGEAWTVSAGVVWDREPDGDLPIPTSEIKFFSRFTIITKDDVAWQLTGGSWQSIPFPGTVSVKSPTWTDVKKVYRGEK